jgi:predicted ester cyclase
MPDLRNAIEDSFSGGSRVATRVTGYGTMSGSVFGHPPGAKEMDGTEIHFRNLEKGRLTDHRAVIDCSDTFRKLGPTPETGSTEI